jgi:hypothetical protein
MPLSPSQSTSTNGQEAIKAKILHINASPMGIWHIRSGGQAFSDAYRSANPAGYHGRKDLWKIGSSGF